MDQQHLAAGPYAPPVLALIALRQMEAKFEKVQAELYPQFKGRLKATPADLSGPWGGLPTCKRPVLASLGSLCQAPPT
jgi:hypothetical protein